MRASRSEPGKPDEMLGCEYRLAMARNLSRVYADVLDKPIPADLRAVIARLVAQRERHHRSA